MVQQIIDPAAISGLLDPYVKQYQQEQLGAGVGEAFKALQAEDYPRMARALQGIAGENPQLGVALMTQAHQAQAMKQQERLRQQELNKPSMHASDMGIITFYPGTGSMTLKPWIQDEQGNPTLGPEQAFGGGPGGPGGPAARPAAAAATPAQPAQPAATPPSPVTAPPATPATPPPQAATGGPGQPPGPDDIAHLRSASHGEQAKVAAQFDRAFGTPADPHPSAAILNPLQPAAAAPAVAQGSSVIGSPIPGASLTEQRKAAAHEGTKIQAQMVESRNKALVQLPKVQQLARDWQRLVQLGGTGSVMGSTPMQQAYRFLPLNKEITDLQGKIRQGLTELQFQANALRGQGAVSNYERSLVAMSMPELSNATPGIGLRYFGNLIQALQTDIARGSAPVR
jgi:hypothetical protein